MTLPKQCKLEPLSIDLHHKAQLKASWQTIVEGVAFVSQSQTDQLKVFVPVFSNCADFSFL
jgi:hypothetical protein